MIFEQVLAPLEEAELLPHYIHQITQALILKLLLQKLVTNFRIPKHHWKAFKQLRLHFYQQLIVTNPITVALQQLNQAVNAMDLGHDF